MKLEIIGAPFGFGQRLPGLEQAPDALRQAGLLQSLESFGWSVQDQGNMTLEVLNPGFAAWQVASLVRDKVFETANTGSFCLTIGGDHSISIGTIQGALLANPDLTVVWVDAHGDMNTYATSPSGNIHGMPVAALLGLLPKVVSGPYLRPEKLILVGTRSLDPGELALIETLKIRVFTTEDIQSRGIEAVMQEVIAPIDTTAQSPIHLSFDIDAVDPFIAPATGLHVEGGLSARDAIFIATSLAQTSRLVSMDLVEINPLASKNQEGLNTTLKLGIDIIGAACDQRLQPSILKQIS